MEIFSKILDSYSPDQIYDIDNVFRKTLLKSPNNVILLKYLYYALMIGPDTTNQFNLYPLFSVENNHIIICSSIYYILGEIFKNDATFQESCGIQSFCDSIVSVLKGSPLTDLKNYEKYRQVWSFYHFKKRKRYSSFYQVPIDQFIGCLSAVKELTDDNRLQDVYSLSEIELLCFEDFSRRHNGIPEFYNIEDIWTNSNKIEKYIQIYGMPSCKEFLSKPEFISFCNRVNQQVFKRDKINNQITKDKPRHIGPWFKVLNNESVQTFDELFLDIMIKVNKNKKKAAQTEFKYNKKKVKCKRKRGDDKDTIIKKRKPNEDLYSNLSTLPLPKQTDTIVYNALPVLPTPSNTNGSLYNTSLPSLPRVTTPRINSAFCNVLQSPKFNLKSPFINNLGTSISSPSVFQLNSSIFSPRSHNLFHINNNNNNNNNNSSSTEAFKSLLQTPKTFKFKKPTGLNNNNNNNNNYNNNTNSLKELAKICKK